jgi:catechol 2,3-dioxygenase-like lactoylglutathione lyase family enzyme
MKVLRCLHTAILVSNLERAKIFYGDILGLPLSANRSLKFPGVWYQIGDFQLHLIVCDDFTVSIANQEKWGRNPHLALAIDDLELAKQKLQQAGYPIQMSASGRAALFTQDPDGNIIELGQ